VLIRLAECVRNTPPKIPGVDPAQNVAGLMISSDKALRGVAPAARLYSAAVGSLKTGGQPEECVSAQHVALQNGRDVRALTSASGKPRARPATKHFRWQRLAKQCIDWSARVHNVLYVIAGNQGRHSIPTDNFNGVNVAFTNRRQEF